MCWGGGGGVSAEILIQQLLVIYHKITGRAAATFLLFSVICCQLCTRVAIKMFLFFFSRKYLRANEFSFLKKCDAKIRKFAFRTGKNFEMLLDIFCSNPTFFSAVYPLRKQKKQLLEELSAGKKQMSDIK